MPLFLTPLKMGNRILLEKSEIVSDPLSTETQEIIKNMLFTIQSIGERVGLAAPQVGILKRVIVYRVPATPVNSRYNNIQMESNVEIPWSVLINPMILSRDEDITFGWEGCVSVPHIMGYVPRSNSIAYTGFDENGVQVHREVSGFHARLIQHEIDHLDGILFPMRVTDMSKFGFEDEIQNNFF